MGNQHHIEEYSAERMGLGEWQQETARNAQTALRALSEHLGDRDTPTPADVAAVLAACSAPATRRRWFAVIRGYSSWAVARGYIETDPTAGMRGPRVGQARPRGLDDLAWARIWRACQSNRDRLIVSLARREGLRRAEIAGLTADDIDRAHGVLYVLGKGGKTRFVPISEQTRRLLRSAPRSGAAIRDSRHPNRPLSAAGVGRAVTRIMRRAGVADKEHPRSGVSLHALRHTCAHELLALPDVDPRDVADWLGHAHVATTLDIYGRRAAAVGRLQHLARARATG